MARPISLIAVALCVVTFGAIHTPAVQAMPVANGVIGDDHNDAYIGSGGLLLPSSFSGGGSTKRKVASCLGCTWKYSIYCAADSTDMCAHAVTTCPPGQVRYRVWFGQTSDSVSVIGSVCWGSHTPATRKQIEDRMDDLVIRYVPALHIDCDPPGDTLTTIPTVCFTSQPTVITPPTFTLATHVVRIKATAKWRWDWGDGEFEWRSVPGKPYPSKQILHQYRSAGSYAVRTKAVWDATYSVAGLGTFPVSGDLITQEAHLGMHVHSSRALRTVSR